MDLQPKAIHDEMNASAFDEFGRMTANLGLEVVPATPAGQNIVLYPYVNPSTELIDATNLPKITLTTDPGTGLPSDVMITPISSATDGTQIWKITHNGVDTHPIHWHLYDVQVLNRVTWDNIIIPTEPSELGWKDTLRVSPLEDTIVALRPIIPSLPFELPNSVRPLNPMMPIGSTLMFNSVDANGNPTDPIINQYVNFGWEYVWHCHILSYEEMDMMRPVSVAVPPKTPALAVQWTGNCGSANVNAYLIWTNPANETGFTVQRATSASGPWTDLATLPQDVVTYTDLIGTPTQVLYYRVIAHNRVGYTGTPGYSTMEVSSTSLVAQTDPPPASPLAPSNLIAGAQFNSEANIAQTLAQWADNSTNETGFQIERCTTTDVCHALCNDC